MKSAVALGLLSQILASSAHPHHGTGNTNAHIARRGIDISAYQTGLPSKYNDSWDTENSTSVATVMAKRSTVSSYIQTSTALVKQILPTAEFRVINDSYIGSNGIAHVNFRQTANGLDIANADFNVNLWKNGTIFSYGHSFYSGKIPTLSRRDASTPEAALKGAIKTLKLPIKASKMVAQESKNETELYTIKGTTGADDDPKAKLVYIQNDNGTLSLSWRVETNLVDNWLTSYVDATTNTKIHSVVDYVSDFAEYNVYPWGVIDPTHGNRIIEVDPWTAASPATWHTNTSDLGHTLAGNNAIAQDHPSDKKDYDHYNVLEKYYRPYQPDQNFNYSYSPSMKNAPDYINASLTQMFYTVNKYHDLLYLLGFTETAGNFQIDNFDYGGYGKDPVALYAQDGTGMNNALFAAPPDGTMATMRMFLWDKSSPSRDAAFASDVIIHEYTHGVSSRLTGGSFNAECLMADESRCMNEGWSDIMSIILQIKKTDNRNTSFVVAPWVSNDPKGLRKYPYTTDMKINPWTYKMVNDMEVRLRAHVGGNAWASILYDVSWDLIEKYGHPAGDTPKLDKNGIPTDGKFFAMKLFMDGMALQPCRPDFVSARQAIIDADRALTGGANKCLLWKAFARRGLGRKAKFDRWDRVESFDIPWFTC